MSSFELPVYDYFENNKPFSKVTKEETRLVFVAWPYMNGKLHVGHLAGYLLPADCIARAFRMLGYKTLMISGSDCYGTPILVTALKEQTSPEQVVQFYHEEVIKLFKAIDISFDNYSATVNRTHHEVVKDAFYKILLNGFIKKDFDLQFFSPTLGRFLPDRFVVGDCPFCGASGIKSDQCENCSEILTPQQVLNPVSIVDGKPVELKKTEHYFFDWPKLQGRLENYFNDRKAEWRDWIVSETKKWFNQGLKPRAITRDIDWGIPIPSDIPASMLIEDFEKKRIYVWFEAVTGYLSSTIEYCRRNNLDVNLFWRNPNSKHYYFMGKDNLPFHTIFWPGQLMALDSTLHLPNIPAINQYLLFGDEKFSKSAGRIIDSYDFTQQYGADAVRFYFLAFSPETSDFSFNLEHFKEQTNSLLVGKIGNYISRVTKLAGNGFKPSFQAKAFETYVKFLDQYLEGVDSGSSRKMCQTVLEYTDSLNKAFSDAQPWNLDKSDNRFKSVISEGICSIVCLTSLLKPIIPNAVRVVEESLAFELFEIITSKDALEAALTDVLVRQGLTLFSKL